MPVRPERYASSGPGQFAAAAFFVLCVTALVMPGALFAQAPETPLPKAAPRPATTVQILAPFCGTDIDTEQQKPGTIQGTLIDQNGSPVIAATVKIARDGQPASQETQSDENGQFAFQNLAPGPFHLAISAQGFAAQEIAGKLGSGESCAVPQVTLQVATNVTEVRVELSTFEIAQQQIEAQEKQRLFGVIPNFYVSYEPHAAPLSSKQKFQLAWKSTIDPVSFGVTGVIAGVQQATNAFGGYGQGAAGYARRYGASYGDLVAGTFIGGAIFPSILKQDPRYFYKGRGSVRSRALYAIANAVICKGDNGHWQPNYSGIMGSLAAGGISNLYYPPADREDVAVTFENTLIGIGETAAVNLLQEFVMKKLTPNVPNDDPPSHP